MWMQSVAWAQTSGGSGSGSGTLLSLIPFALIFVIFYFLVILPQQKRRNSKRRCWRRLKKGDKVVTASGIWGTVTNLGKETVTLQIADNTKIRMQRDQIARLRGRRTRIRIRIVVGLYEDRRGTRTHMKKVGGRLTLLTLVVVMSVIFFLPSYPAILSSVA